MGTQRIADNRGTWMIVEVAYHLVFRIVRPSKVLMEM